MTMPYSGQTRRGVHYVFNPDHYIGIVIANTTLLYKQELFLKKDVRRSTNIIFFYEQYFTEIT